MEGGIFTEWVSHMLQIERAEHNWLKLKRIFSKIVILQLEFVLKVVRNMVDDDEKTFLILVCEIYWIIVT